MRCYSHDRRRLVYGSVYQMMRAAIALCLATSLSALESGWRYAEVTAYCPCSICCGASADGITYDNTNVRHVPYNLASDRSLPIGTTVFIPLGLGVLDNARKYSRWFTVDDRGGALDTESRKYNTIRLDLRVKSHWWAKRFGRQTIPVYIQGKTK